MLVLVGPVLAVPVRVVGELGEPAEELRVRVTVDRVLEVGDRDRGPGRVAIMEAAEVAGARDVDQAVSRRAFASSGRVRANTLTSPSWSQWLLVTNSASARSSGWSR